MTSEHDLPEGAIEVETLDEDSRVLLETGEVVPLSTIVNEYQPTSWLDSDPAQLETALTRRKQNRDLLLGWITDSLVDGSDYGRIHVINKNKCPDGARCENPHHFSKPSLWKAGAEKIVGMLGFRAHWPELELEMANIKAGSKTIAMRCQLIGPDGSVVSEGAGARMIESDYGDINRALKMAKKSGLIDAVLNAAGLSAIFTQDLEDNSGPRAPLADSGREYLWEMAEELFGDDAKDVLSSLAKLRFKISDGDWGKIPAYRLQDAVRSLKEKARFAEFLPGDDDE
jgi:hypothetical protein